MPASAKKEGTCIQLDCAPDLQRPRGEVSPRGEQLRIWKVTRAAKTLFACGTAFSLIFDYQCIPDQLLIIGDVVVLGRECSLCLRSRSSSVISTLSQRLIYSCLLVPYVFWVRNLREQPFQPHLSFSIWIRISLVVYSLTLRPSGWAFDLVYWLIILLYYIFVDPLITGIDSANLQCWGRVSKC